MSKLLPFLKPYRGALLVVLALAVGQSLSNLFLPNLLADIVNNGIVTRDTGYIWRTGGLMLLVASGGVLCAIIGISLASQVATGFGRNVRASLFTHVEYLSLYEFEAMGTAALITRTTNDTMQVQSVLVMLLNVMITAPITMSGGIILAINQDAGLSWIFVVILPLLLLIILLLMRRAIPLFAVIQAKLERLNLILDESLTGVRVIRAFDRARHEEERFNEANAELTSVATVVNRLVASLLPILMLLLNVAGLAILWFGALRINRGEMQIGALFAFLQYALQILFALLMVSMMFALLPRAAASAERIQHVLMLQPEKRKGASKREIDGGRGRIEFQNVTFRYPGAQEPALTGISFVARPGEITAIIGGTGAGKSTMIGLIPRFYDGDQGRVLVDGVDVRELPLEELRARIGFVPQKAVLFSGTIAENIRVGKATASQAEIEQAVEIAQAGEFIATLEEGLEAVIAQGGTNISGGQKQRLAIARALVRRPDIYIFDDSFSALDFQTDARLRAALKKETRSATVLLVTQRVSSILDADQILVLDEGRCVGAGTHRVLLNTCEVYREIVLSQLSAKELTEEIV